jgi:putative membrane protein
MKTTILAIALATTLASSAFAQSVGEKTGVNSALGVTPEAAASDMLEIDASKVAQQKGNADEKKFAEQMITDHTKTSTELKELVPSDMKSAIPTSLDDSFQKKLDKLNDAKPEDFASEYDPMQVSAHKDAVSLFELYSKGGDDAKLKDWAGKTLPAASPGDGPGDGQEPQVSEGPPRVSGAPFLSSRRHPWCFFTRLRKLPASRLSSQTRQIGPFSFLDSLRDADKVDHGFDGTPGRAGSLRSSWPHLQVRRIEHRHRGRPGGRSLPGQRIERAYFLSEPPADEPPL